MRGAFLYSTTRSTPNNACSSRVSTLRKPILIFTLPVDLLFGSFCFPSRFCVSQHHILPLKPKNITNNTSRPSKQRTHLSILLSKTEIEPLFSGIAPPQFEFDDFDFGKSLRVIPQRQCVHTFDQASTYYAVMPALERKHCPYRRENRQLFQVPFAGFICEYQCPQYFPSNFLFPNREKVGTHVQSQLAPCFAYAAAAAAAGDSRY